MQDYSKFWKDKFENEKKILNKRKEELNQFARKCSELLKKRYNVKKVYLIGSLARNNRIHNKSDIDLVVIGLPDNKYFSALNDLYKLVPKGINLDLITLETASENIKDVIEKEGILI